MQKQKQKRTERRIDRNQIRLLLSTDMEAGDELALLEEKYGEDFFPDGYQVCIAGKGFVMEEREDVFFIDDLQDGNLCIVLPGLFGVLQKNELWHEYAGVSAVHRGLCELKTAYDEAFSARKSAFYTETPFIEYGGGETGQYSGRAAQGELKADRGGRMDAAPASDRDGQDGRDGGAVEEPAA